MTDKIKDAVDFYVSKGWQKHQAAGIVGNLLAESNLNPTASGDNGTAFGIAQWRGQRLTGLKQFAERNGKPASDLLTQLAYLDHELNTTESAAGNRLKAASDVTQANDAMITFERPLGSNHGVRNAHNYNSRLNLSNKVFGTDAGATINDNMPVGTAQAPMAYDAYTKGAPSRPDIYTETAQKLQNDPKPYNNFFEEVGASFNNVLTADAIRWASEDTHDPLYSVPEDQKNEIISKYPSDYHDFLLFAGSERNLTSRLKWADEDIERRQKLAAGGGSAIAAGLVANMLDPISLGVGVATGGLGVAAKGASLGTKVATGALYGASSNVGLEATSKYVFDDPHSDLVSAAGIGAVFGAFGGAIARTGRVNDANAIFAEGTRLSFKEQSPAVTPAVTSTLGSPMGNLSAAKNTQMKDSLVGENLAHAIMLNDESVPKAFGKGVRFDVTGQMTTSDNPLVRQVGYTFFEETAGTRNHDVIPDSVNSKFTANYRLALKNFNDGFQQAKTAYISDMGASRFNMLKKAELSEEFNRLVTDYVEAPYPLKADVHPEVIKAGNTFREGMQDVAKQLREAGFEIPDNANYVPLITNAAKIAEIDNAIHHETIEKFIYQAIKNHSPEIDRTLAQKMSKGWWQNIRKAGFGMDDDAAKAIQLGDREAFKKAFGDALEDNTMLSSNELDKVFNIMSGMVDAAKKTNDNAKGMSRLKKRTLMDYTHKATVKDRFGNDVQLSMRDFFENDAEFLMNRYLRQMLPRIEFAKTKLFNPDTGELLIDGFKSEADISKLKNLVTESYRKRGTPLDSNEVQTNLRNIDFAWKRINGIPVWNQSNAAAQWARRIKDSQFIRLMGNMGLNQIQESWKIMSMTGFRAALQQLPAIKTMMKSVQNGSLKANQLIDELSSLTGLGTEYLFNTKSLKLSDDRIGASVFNKFERRVDNALDVGKQITSQLSLMRVIMDYQQRWAMAAIAQQMTNLARKATVSNGVFKLSKLSKNELDRLATLGMGKDDLKLLFKNLLNNSEFKGEKITGVNLSKWDADAVTKFRYFLGRYTDRLVQANDFGGLSKWMSHPVASMFIQFRPFVLGAWAKSTLHALNHGAFTDPKMLTLLLGEWAAGTATFIVRQSEQLANEEGAEKFWNETMQPTNLLKNGWARTASASVLPLLLDSLLVATPLEPQFGNARSSGTAVDALIGSPVVDQIKSAQNFSKGTMNSLINGDPIKAKDIRSGVRAFVPWSNWVPLAAAFNSLVHD